jgi:UDP-N-acetylmuramate dehydrogenase
MSGPGRAPSPIQGRTRTDVPMAGLTAWGVGGKAARVFEPADVADLQAYLTTMPSSEPVLFVGLGSNLLVRDGGFPGTVVVTTRGLTQLECRDPGIVRAQAGVACAKLARFAASEDLTGAEFFAGIPGSFGGALAMNAGAFGGETWPLVAAVETLDRQGRLKRRPADEFQFGYREVIPPSRSEEWFVAGEVCLRPGDGSASRAEMRALLRARGESQPTGQRSCGSVFKNPPGDFAGRLVEAAGLKGTRIGGARVSEEHANFIINDDAATAADIEQLIEAVLTRVEADVGVRLTPEVRIVGEPM